MWENPPVSLGLVIDRSPGREVTQINNRGFSPIMDFPSSDWEFFPSEDFGTAEVRSPGVLGAEVFAQQRPNGRIMDHWSIRLGGSELLKASISLQTIIQGTKGLAAATLSIQSWPRDIMIKQNTTTSEWIDVSDALAAGDLSVSDEDGEIIDHQNIIGELKKLKNKEGRSGSYRWAVVIAYGAKLNLQLQCLPAPADYLAGRPIFRR